MDELIPGNSEGESAPSKTFYLDAYREEEIFVLLGRLVDEKYTLGDIEQENQNKLLCALGSWGENYA